MESNQCFNYGVCVRGQLSYAVITYVKYKDWIKEKNQRINEFYFAYLLNPVLHTNKVFRDQVKGCLSNTFGVYNYKHINKTLMKRDKRVLALVVFYEIGNFNPRKIFRVLSCVIYTIIDRYVYIDYLGTETKKISELRLGYTLIT